MAEFHEIKKHWDEVGGSRYRYFWESLFSHQKLSEREKDFIKKFIPKARVKALDYGTGSGRFLNVLLENSSFDSEIYALDISEEMVKYCLEIYGNNKKIKGIEIIRKGKELYSYYQTKFDFITAIRVLKYNSNWQEILKNLFDLLSDNGMIIFTMPKKYLINRIIKQKNLFRKNIGEIKEIGEKNNMKIIEIKGFAKIPEIFYGVNNKLFSKILLFTEKILRIIFGEQLFEREVFYVSQK